MRKFYIKTFGCQMNVLDSEKMAGILESRGFLSSSGDDADIFIFNTCSVREKAEEKLFSYLGRLKKKKKNRKFLIGVCGCVAQVEGERIFKRAPYVDFVLGTRRFFKIGDVVRYLIENYGEKILDVEMDGSPYPPEIKEIKRNEKFREYVLIMEGCNNFCSYCIVPFTRGRERSRKLENVLGEVKRYIKDGAVEINLLGQNVNSYRDPDGYDFVDLLSEVSKIEGLKRIRFTTSHPKDFNEELLSVMVANKNICKHIHLPPQSGSNKILKLMNRKYTREEYLEKIDMIKSTGIEFGISGDFIVGFPTESREDYEKTLSLLEEVKYSSIFSFKYSPRPNTLAWRKFQDMDEKIKLERLMNLQDFQKKIQLELNKSKVGKVYEVLVESISKKGDTLMGRTEQNYIVNFSGDRDLIGNIVKVKITDFSAQTLKGELFSM